MATDSSRRSSNRHAAGSRGTVRAAVALSLAAGAVFGVATAEPAQAALSVSVINTDGQGVASRHAPRLDARNGYGAPAGARVTTRCWTWGDAVGPNTNRLWWLIDYAGRTFYVADRYLSTPNVANRPPAGETQCGVSAPVSSREARAVDFARSQLGVRSTSLTPDGMWSGWCELFVERAYGTSGRYPSAQANFNAQRAAGRVRTDTNPPAGALVFYAWGSYGHVGVSLGGGQVISTQGFSTPLPVRQHTVTGINLQYLGWAAAPTSWPGR